MNYFINTFFVTILCFEAGVMLGYFTSAFVLEGYRGKDKIVDLIEIGAFFKHVLAFVWTIIATAKLFMPLIKEGYMVSDSEWWFLGVIFTTIMGAEVYGDVSKRVLKSKGRGDAKE